MRVDPQPEPGVGVAEVGGDALARVQEDRGVRVTQDVHAVVPVVGNAARAGGRLPHARIEGRTTHRLEVRRVEVFVVLPVVVLFLLAENTVWEIVRANVNAEPRSEWPLRFSLVDLSTSVNLLGIGLGLLLARQQWARALRPTIGTGINEGRRGEKDGRVWQIWMFNDGPGMAV